MYGYDNDVRPCELLFEAFRYFGPRERTVSGERMRATTVDGEKKERDRTKEEARESDRDRDRERERESVRSIIIRSNGGGDGATRRADGRRANP